MSTRLLLEYITEALNEGPITIDQASQAALGLLKYQSGPRTTLVLFNPRESAKAVYAAIKRGETKPEQWSDAIEPHVVGMMQLKEPEHPQWGAKTVSSVAAEKGYGPLLYDIAMTIFKRIAPDRKSVSPDAERVWSVYATKRNDVKKLPIDDAEHPKTPERRDDGTVHPGGPENPLNNAFEGANTDASKLVRACQKFIDWGKASGLSEKSLEDAVRYAGSGYFKKRYLA